MFVYIARCGSFLLEIRQIPLKQLWWNTDKHLPLDRRRYSLLGPWSSHRLHRCQCCTAWQDHWLWSLLVYLPQMTQESGWLFYIMAVIHCKLFSVSLLWIQECWKNIVSNSWDSHCWYIGSIMWIHSFLYQALFIRHHYLIYNWLFMNFDISLCDCLQDMVSLWDLSVLFCSCISLNRLSAAVPCTACSAFSPFSCPTRVAVPSPRAVSWFSCVFRVAGWDLWALSKASSELRSCGLSWPFCATSSWDRAVTCWGQGCSCSVGITHSPRYSHRRGFTSI